MLHFELWIEIEHGLQFVSYCQLKEIDFSLLFLHILNVFSHCKACVYSFPLVLESFPKVRDKKVGI